ncbi:hypothetical protein NDU88_001169 [Pleurodeles waltl]|uniref:Uncharacterized protein n=1 Tax=Pleurodeles waltl TaxID=8319 RepID=A0AAV7SA84_PLEWA|nr:hypothetical protein NDU88_001169 [Pleurodeles waltl]
MGGSSPSPAASDGCPLELLLLLLAVVLLASGQVARQAAVLPAVQVTVLSVLGGGSSPSPAASDGCPLGLLLLLPVMLLAVGQVVVLPAVQVAVLAAVQVAVLAVMGGGSSPSPAASDGCSAMAGVVCPFLPLADGGASLLLPAGVPFLPLLAGGASFPLLVGGASFPLLGGGPFLALAGGRPFLALAGGAGTLAVLTGASLEPHKPAVAAETTVAVDLVAEVLGWVLATLARSEGRG